MTHSEQQYTDLFTKQRRLIDGHAAEVMNARREQAFSHFCQNGLPTRRVERYKYTDMQKMFEPDYGLNLSRLNIPVDPYRAFRCDVPNLSTSLYFVVNDTFYDKVLPKTPLPEGVEVEGMALFAQRHPQLAEKYYGSLADTADDGVTALNTMLAQDALVVYVPRGVKVERTIQVINILRSDVDLMANRRVLIVVEDRAEVGLLFCDHTADDRQFLTTQVVEAYVGKGASLNLYQLEETHARNTLVGNSYIAQEADSHVNHFTVTLHNGVTRTRTDLLLQGEGASCEVCGCVVADKQQRADHNTLIDHQAAHCTSKELYKYVLDEQAVGAFAGKVLVRPGAQQTSSEETNQNLCVAPSAHMYTQPMLEIYADDVKCSHGSTVGQMNDAALFYMRQRGISLEEARLLLEVAFVNEVIERMHLSQLRDRLHYLIDKRFRGELSKCEGCQLCR